MLLNAAKCQCYNFYRFWVIKGKPTGGCKSTLPTQIRVKKLKNFSENNAHFTFALNLVYAKLKSYSIINEWKIVRKSTSNKMLVSLIIVNNTIKILQYVLARASRRYLFAAIERSQRADLCKWSCVIVPS